ncbi:MAG: hypothetical protein IJJ00_04500 [Erysipelotrichaceae bacterium]|nr:hypothetical protein [Erysipelotrichaceae bacterium]
MYEILKTALSVAIGVVIGQLVYDEINNLRYGRPILPDMSDEEFERIWEDSWSDIDDDDDEY